MATAQPNPKASPTPSNHNPGRVTPDTVSTNATSPRSPISVNGTKRKRNSEPKFYSVRVGHKPGIYQSWNDCLAQVKGFKGAVYKSFTSLPDANLFLSGKDPSQDPKSASFSPPKFYGVRNGLVPGVYTDWPSAQKQIRGCTRPKHRCFSTRAEAEAFVKGELDSDKDGASDGHASDRHASVGASVATDSETVDHVDNISAKKQKKEDTQDLPDVAISVRPQPPGTGPLPKGAVDDFDPNILMNPKTGAVVYKTDAQMEATRALSTGLKSTSVLRIYTDGSSLGNGKQGATAGVGVYFGRGDERNVSEALSGPRQTNQRAELTAIVRALDIAPKHRDVDIYTDSRYSIDCVTTWYVNWRKNNWKTSAGKPVENRDLVEDILKKVEERKSLQVSTNFIWLKGHANDPGNIEADKLAVNGARNSKN